MTLPPYIPAWSELRPFVGELWLVAALVGVLIAPFFTRKANVAAGLVTLACLGFGLLGLLIVGSGTDGEYFRGMLVSDRFAWFFKIILFVFTIFIVLMWFSASSSEMHEGDGPEFFTLLLGAALGMSLMSCAANLLMIFLAIELASLPSYVLAAFRKTDRLGAEASLKYVLFGAATAAIMVYGMSLLYGLYGSLSVVMICSKIAAGASAVPMGATAPLLAVALLTLLVGIAFKIAAAPFHFWCPDVFQGAGVDVAAFLSVASKGAAIILLFRLLNTLAGSMNYAAVQPLTTIAIVIGILGAITATVGNTAAFVQQNIKRLLAYSSIAHAGYMLCAISLIYGPSAAGLGLPVDAAQAILLYLAVYMLMNLGAFTVAAMVQRQTGGENLSDFAGLGRRSPLLTLCMGVFLFSLIGLPPFAGFVAKLNIMLILARGGGWWWWLVAIIGLNTILSLYYYARVLKVMILESSNEPPFTSRPIGAGICVICAASLVLLFIGFGSLMRLTETYGRLHVTPAADVVTMGGPADSSR